MKEEINQEKRKKNDKINKIIKKKKKLHIQENAP